MEEQFLQSQKDRLVSLKQREQARRSEESTACAAAAEASLEKRWVEWNKRLEAMAETTEPPKLESQRRDMRLSFNELQEILNAQRREVALNDSLSDAGLLRWHKALVAGQSQLDKIQAKLLPKGKFVFRRYRQAIENRQLKGESLVSQAAEYPKKHYGGSSLVATADTLANCLQDHKNEDIRITFKGIERRAVDSDTTRQLEFDGGTVPLVWRRLEKCSVTWLSCSTWQQSSSGGAVLHLVDLKDCQLHINTYLSSIHVTDCRNLTLRVSQVQQVRLHTSADVKVWGRITGGTILEECQRIGVTTHCANVQDFSWLKAGRPSPNLVRLPEAQPQQPGPSSMEDAMKSNHLTAGPQHLKAVPVINATCENIDDEEEL